jgi:hypothetical protein
MQIGDKTIFDRYEWRVLDVQNNAALIITDEIIEQHAYHNKYKNITWADCELRQYLNGEFYNRFTDDNKARIIQVTNKNLDNQWYGTPCGEDTQDSIFLLSIEEAACKYFGDSSKILQNRKKNQRYWFQSKDENNSRRQAKCKGDGWYGWASWWLRCAGRDNLKAVYMHGTGDIGINGNNISKIGGVRPALWLKIDSSSR